MTSAPMVAAEQRAPVVVVGGGLVGCALAAALSQQGVEVMVLERDAEVPDLLRGELIMPAGVSILDELGLGGVLREVCTETQGVALHHPAFDGGRCDVDYDLAPPPLTHETAWKPRGLCGWRKPMYEALRRAVQQRAGVRFRDGVEIRFIDHRTDGLWTLRSRSGERFTTPMVVAADGWGSRLRRQRGFVPVSARQDTFVQGFVGRAPGYDRVRVQVGACDLGAVFVFPFPGGRFRCTLEHAALYRDDLRGPDALDIHLDLLRRALPEVWRELGAENIDIEGGLQVQPGRSITLASAVEDGFALVGDAGGCLDPFTGFGMALGLADAAGLAEVLATGDFSASSLRRYESARSARIAQRREVTQILAYMFLDKSEGFAPTLATKIAARWRDRDWILPQVAGQFAGYDPIVEPSIGMTYHMLGLV